MKSGIDISHHNGVIDFKKVKAHGISFAYIKLTEGTTFTDAMAMQNATGCLTNQIKFGFYHFAQPRKTSARNEADYFSKLIKTMPAADLIPVLDIETNPVNLDKPTLTQWVKDFVDQMNKNGHTKIMLYTYASWFNDNFPDNHGLGNLPLWIASYRTIPSMPKGWSTFSIWQYSATGKVDGISGDVDLDRSDLLPLVVVGGVAIIVLIIFAFLFLYLK